MFTPKKTTVWFTALSFVVLGLFWKVYQDNRKHRVLSGFVQRYIGLAQFVEQSRVNGLNGGTPAVTATCLKHAAEFEYPDESSVRAEYLASAPQGTQYCVTELQRIVTRERTAAIKELIAHLRATTGHDLGDDPQPWIKEFANKKYPRPRAKPVKL